MPRRNLLSSEERARLLAFPESPEELIQYYSFSEADLSAISQRCGPQNRLGFAVQLCYLRYPGFVLPNDLEPPLSLLSIVARQLKVDPEIWNQYAKQRPETRRDHVLELQAWLNLSTFSIDDYRRFVQQLSDLAMQTDRGIVLAEALVNLLRQHKIILPVIDVIERLCSEAMTLGTRKIYELLTAPLLDHHRQSLDGLLKIKKETSISILSWLFQAPGFAKPKHILVHLERLNTIRDLDLPEGLEQVVHQNRLLKISREGGQMTAQHLRDLEPLRRYATLVAVVIDARATLIDEIIDLHDRFMGSLFSKAKRRHADQFQESGKEINDKVRLYSKIGHALLEAKKLKEDPFKAIEKIISWEDFEKSLAEADELAKPEEFDYLELMGDDYSYLRRYTPLFLDSLNMKAIPGSSELLAAIQIIKEMNQRQTRKTPEDSPLSFVRKRWKNLVQTAEGIDRRFYELCVLSELKNSLRSGDIWVQGSRQFKDFEDYLLPKEIFSEKLKQNLLGLPIETDCEKFLESRLGYLDKKMAEVEKLAAANELPDALITQSGRLKITPLDNAVPDKAQELIQEISKMLPRIKITELLLEVDSWTGLTREFKHLKSGDELEENHLLLTAILADGVNLGLGKMAESCPGVTYAKLAWIQAWHIREETYSAGLAKVINAQSRHPFSAYWGDGTTSSSDGQNFKAGSGGKFAGHVNLKYGQEPGIQFYTHISNQYAPFHINAITSTIRDSTYVLDGLLYHESDLMIQEHYTDTAGFTDHVFALMHLLGFKFAPRIRDLADKRLYIQDDAKRYPTLAGMIGGNINLKQIRDHWGEILRLATSIKQGTVTASLMLRKLGSYPRQNGLALALRELGRIERTLFSLEWMQSVELRRRVQVGLNKGEAKNALARAVFMNRLGEIRDRSFENQRYRAGGLNLIVAAIILWNTVYIDRAVQSLRDSGIKIDEELLAHLSPLGWEHINLMGDYIWPQNKLMEPGKFRPLRTSSESKRTIFSVS